ncbi:hypothetical protein MIND_01082400 [Mycena indigotica]|uniref:F-box domain-containing protein n=1 Tax=Mycena indigotica TaxID=2126181 RepID=A0A8H6VYZ2_9AGAR|nr:uncharacterized protein MIND_01082400 [Mycena indigotica]KAF7295428.1 hypothetical protein MIND_01082400 [Mycena indigotica]
MSSASGKSFEPADYLKYYPGTIKPVPAEEQAEVLNDKGKLKQWQDDFMRGRPAQQRARAEDYVTWTLPLPREIMDMILGDPVLGVREHLMLAATCPELRRLYHSYDIWSIIMDHRTIPLNGKSVFLSSKRSPEPAFITDPPKGLLAKLATAPQKKKAYGAFFKPMYEAYASHDRARRLMLHHRISRDKIRRLYPLVTDDHLARLHYYEAFTGGYASDRTAAGYAEAAVEFISIRISNGMA